MRRRFERTPVASVVIPVHDAADVIGDQMQALCAQTDVDHFEVIAVLNRCTDGSAHVIESFADRLDVRVVTADRLASAAYARNTGAAAARSQRVLFCDADDRVSPTWVRDLVDGLDVADFVGGRVLVDRDGLAEWAYRYFYADKEAGLLVREGRIPYPISASMGIRKDALSAVDGFDENFSGASGEETDMAIRLVREGFRVGFVDGAMLRYRPRTGFRELSRQQRARAFSNSRLSLREGVEIPRPSIALQAFRTVRRLGRRILLERTLHPLALASDVVVGAARYSAARWASTATEPQYDHDPGVLDFVVELGAPVIGGLAFRTNHCAVHSDSRTDETHRTLLALLSRLLAPGDSVVEFNARIGLVTVAVARIVEHTERVVALETDAGARELLRSNLMRHGCPDVEVPDEVPQDLSELAAVVGHGVTVSQGGDIDSNEDFDAAKDDVSTASAGAVVVVGIGRSESARTIGRIAVGLRPLGLRAWVVESTESGAGARVRPFESEWVNDPRRALPETPVRWLVGIPIERHDDMVRVVEAIRPLVGARPERGADTGSAS